MTTQWRRSAYGLWWQYKTAGVDHSVACDREGWISVRDLKPDHGWQVLVVGQPIDASTAAPHKADTDVLHSDDAGEHFTKMRNVTLWRPKPQLPEMYR